MEPTKIDLSKLKKDLAILHTEFEEELPLGNTQKDIDRLRTCASHATSIMMTAAVYLRGLEEHVKKREAEITIQHLRAKDLETPKDKSLEAYVSMELAEEKSYAKHLDNIIDVAKTRVMLIQSFLKSLGEEKWV